MFQRDVGNDQGSGPGAILERHTPNYSTHATDSLFYQYSPQGTVVGALDSSGYAQRYFTDAFGNLLDGVDKNGSASTSIESILHQGRERDAATGLDYFGARWYDPEMGRFVSASPLAPTLEQPYVFCNANPLLYVDLDGLLPTPSPRPNPGPTPPPGGSPSGGGMGGTPTPPPPPGGSDGGDEADGGSGGQGNDGNNGGGTGGANGGGGVGPGESDGGAGDPPLPPRKGGAGLGLAGLAGVSLLDGPEPCLADIFAATGLLYLFYKAHTSKARPSTKEKHEGVRSGWKKPPGFKPNPNKRPEDRNIRPDPGKKR